MTAPTATMSRNYLQCIMDRHTGQEKAMLLHTMIPMPAGFALEVLTCLEAHLETKRRFFNRIHDICCCAGVPLVCKGNVVQSELSMSPF